MHLRVRSAPAAALVEVMEACCLDGRRVDHGVSPVPPRDAAMPAHRDVLVVTFRRSDGTA